MIARIWFLRARQDESWSTVVKANTYEDIMDAIYTGLASGLDGDAVHVTVLATGSQRQLYTMCLTSEAIDTSGRHTLNDQLEQLLNAICEELEREGFPLHPYEEDNAAQ